jgi:hypothetical protein
VVLCDVRERASSKQVLLAVLEAAHARATAHRAAARPVVL